MRKDCESPLEEIRGYGRKSLSQRLLSIQQGYSILNDKSLEFIDTLKCFRLADSGVCVNQKGKAGSIKLSKILEMVTVHPRDDYIAVSYRWSPSEGEDNTKGGYYLESSNKPVKLRNILLDRIIRYVQYITRTQSGSDGDIPFWIDQLSINQHNRRERNLTVQSIDLVYKHCTAAVGYFWVEIKTQDQLDLLGHLLKGHIAYESQQQPMLGNTIDASTFKKVLRLLLLITNDPWWESAWVFQENHTSGTKMWFLIRHSAKLSKRDIETEVGNLPGELVINSMDFRKYTTLFCLAYRQYMAQDKSISNQCNDILSKAGEYTVVYRYDKEDIGPQIRKTISPSILAALGNRSSKHISDIPAISANCLEYPIRLHPTRIKMSRSSLSICILALYLINGEIIKNDKDSPGDLSQNIFQYLRGQAMSLNAPVHRAELTFMKHCRLSVVKLSDDGIVAKGMLWKVCREISTKELFLPSSFADRDDHLKDSCHCGFSEYQRKHLIRLACLLRQLGHKRLAGGLKKFLECDRLSKSSYDEWPSRDCMKMMACQIVAAIDAGVPLQLGLLVGNNPKSHRSYQAIFVRDYHELERPKKSFMFTSWSCTRENMKKGSLTRYPAKYVSLEVDRDGQTPHGCQILRTRQWINGLCFFAGEQTRQFMFPWPRSLLT